jgi:hypothetical protein
MPTMPVLGATVLQGSPADFGKLIADETEKWANVVRAANIKPELSGVADIP